MKPEKTSKVNSVSDSSKDSPRQSHTASIMLVTALLLAGLVVIMPDIITTGDKAKNAALIQKEQSMPSGYDAPIAVFGNKETKLMVYDAALVDGDIVNISGRDIKLPPPDQATVVIVPPGVTSFAVRGAKYGTHGPITLRIVSDAGSVTNMSMKAGETVTVPTQAH